jgi:DNA-binding NtrC family response regulator
VADGALRPELYYRLAVVVVQVPPLRRRVEDIVPLFERVLDAYAQRYRRPRQVVGSRLRERLQRHFWPGNIRELVNLAERVVVLGQEGIDLDVAAEEPVAGMPDLDKGFNLSDYLEGVERRILVEALRNTLRYKLNKYGLLDR